MREIETDYLVVGAGASGMAFVDAFIAASDAEVVMVDRRHRPGGHWIDAYPFVRLHQPSANYGVNSRVLGSDRIDDVGPNAGFYERASAAEVCEYYDRVLEDHLLRSGQVRFFGMCDYRGNGSDGHQVVSILTGEPTTVKVRRKLIDATYLETSIPSRHTPTFEVDDGVGLIPPNALVNLSEPATGYTVLGAGKTAMDTCTWLIDQGVDPDRIRWIKPRDSWAMDRASSQPLALVGNYMELQSRFVEAAAEADSGADFARRLEAHGVFLRVDPAVEPEVFRGAILSQTEVATLRQVTNVVRRGKVRRISTDGLTMTEGTIPSDPGQVYVDCTAAGLRVAPPRPVFEPGRVTIQMVTLGILPWTAATLGYVEASRDDDTEKNRLCPPVPFTGEVSDLLRPVAGGMRGLTARLAEPDLNEWNESSRLNPARGAMARLDEPDVQAAFARMVTNIEAAITNAERLAATPA